jgi:uncharacterized integral membrane protein
MPTDLLALAGQKNSEQSRAQADLSVLLVSLIICLINLYFIVSNQTLAEAIALLGGI